MSVALRPRGKPFDLGEPGRPVPLRVDHDKVAEPASLEVMLLDREDMETSLHEVPGHFFGLILCRIFANVGSDH